MRRDEPFKIIRFLNTYPNVWVSHDKVWLCCEKYSGSITGGELDGELERKSKEERAVGEEKFKF